MAPQIDARKKIEQIRKNKSKNVRDLRQLIPKDSRPKSQSADRFKSRSQIGSGRVSKLSTQKANSRDLRDTRLASRKPAPQSRAEKWVKPAVANTNPVVIRVRDDGTIIDQFRAVRSVAEKRAHYVPPHLQQQQQQAPTYIIAQPMAPTNSQPTVAVDNVVDQTSASVLVSNLLPTINESEIIEIFGNIGVMTAVNMINQTTALVTYQNGSDAVRAVKIYHNRLLDGKPMLVNMMPSNGNFVSSRTRLARSGGLTNTTPMDIDNRRL